jgi:hypothetical protein
MKDIEKERFDKLTGEWKHYCPDWDFMAIDETCPEYDACTCDLRIEKPKDECICKGNWRLLVSECENLLDKIYIDENGKENIFFGLVHGSDDYYYGLINRENKNLKLISCVMSLESVGYKLKDGPSSIS